MAISFGVCWRLLVDYLRPQWGGVLLLAAVLPGSIGLQLTSPQVLGCLIDLARAGSAFGSLAGVAALFIGLALTGQGPAVAATCTGENVGWTATNALRNDLAFHRAHMPGEMVERIDGDVMALANFFSHFVVALLGSALMLVGGAAPARIDAGVGGVMFVFAALSLTACGRIRDIAVPPWAAWTSARWRLLICARP